MRIPRFLLPAVAAVAMLFTGAPLKAAVMSDEDPEALVRHAL